ncbi:pyrroline-5-carboxylate reductase [Ephemerocybe angulata]|uniref:Pyrroline-5-carboxylate reductase n=1 Tax=Ephemerocybe angulata TaxID=980116 RepID=A0A8H6MFW5_9AGAR|nr:pyrroline-5-carboxylate reductase [Tulosesus angulatus]
MGYTLCVLGCGTMGIAVLAGVIDSLDAASIRLDNALRNAGGAANGDSSTPKLKWESHTPGTLTPTSGDPSVPTQFVATVRREESAKKLRDLFEGLGDLGKTVEVVAGSNLEAVQRADVVLLGCKPYMAGAILQEEGVQDALKGKLLISVLAGVTISQLQSLVHPETRVVRAMPNTPCKIREGMTVVSTLPPGPETANDKAIILNIFPSIGRCRFLEEKHFDACTALAGSGPAFACLFLEAMADGGVMMGLPRAEAVELAAQTLQGAARMVLQGNSHPAQIKDSVTTPGGCTIAGLLALEDGKVRSTIARAIQAATERASELGQPAKK